MKLLRLVITSPSGEEQQLVLERDEYILGRDSTASIPLRDPQISRHHARIFRKSNDYFVEDLGSINGVIAKGVAIDKPTKLTPQLEFTIGGFHFATALEATTPRVAFALIGRSPPFENQEFLLPEGQLSVGRVEGNALVIPDISVSRNHALLSVSKQTASLEDLSSGNGTFVNQAKVSQQELHDGDLICFGNVEFKLSSSVRGTLEDSTLRFFGRVAVKRAPLWLAAIAFVVTSIAIIAWLSSHTDSSTMILSTLEQHHHESIDHELTSATRAMEEGDWQAARSHYLSVLQQDPALSKARLGLEHVEQLQDTEKKSRTTPLDGKPAPMPDALQVYINGNLEAAIQQLRPTGADRRLRSRMYEIKRAINQGDLAADMGNIRSALKLWRSAIRFDADLVPEKSKSQTRIALEKRIAVRRYELGASAFQRKVFREAFFHWHEGASMDPDNRGIQLGLVRLEEHAKDLLSIGERQPASVCSAIHEALAITEDDSPVNIKARALSTRHLCSS